jgi:hypothetical protein
MKLFLMLSLLAVSFSSHAEKLHPKILAYQTAAAHGEPKAFFMLGLSYYAGSDVPQDYEKAFEYLSTGAKLNHAGSQSLLGEMYRNGHGVKKDFNLARILFAESAEQGNASGMLNLGNIYFFGEGVTKNAKKGCEYYMKSAIKGTHSQAYYNLGICYYEGHFEGKPNFSEANRWIMKAVVQEHPSAIKFAKNKGWYR